MAVVRYMVRCQVMVFTFKLGYGEHLKLVMDGIGSGCRDRFVWGSLWSPFGYLR